MTSLIQDKRKIMACGGEGSGEKKNSGKGNVEGREREGKIHGKWSVKNVVFTNLNR